MTIKTFRPTRALRLMSLAAFSLLSAVALAQKTPAAPTTGSEGALEHGAPVGDGMSHSTMPGMNGMDKMTMTGDADKDFAMMMKMHHQKGIEMAQMELKNGKSPEMKAAATKIITAQKKEVAQLEAWLAKQK